jgi:4,4'-diaponeurosporenoate glycosyltransferase
MLAALGVLALASLALWPLAFLFLFRVPLCPRARGADSAPLSVSVIIPARNEERSLPALLASLAPRASLEVIVVDDHSQDATAAVAAGAGVRVLAGRPLAEGWLGKPWACWQGALAAGGEWLVFLDADTTLAPGGLDRIVAEAARAGGLVSLWPHHAMRRPDERLAAFFNIVLMAGMGVFTPLGDRVRPRGAFGPCLCCSRADYRAAGGHEAVRGDILDDVAIGRRFAAAGLPVRLYGGRGTISFRMYPGGAGELVAGFAKNFASGFGVAPPAISAMVAAWATGASIAAFCAAAALARGIADAQVYAVTAAYAAYAAQTWGMLRGLGNYTVLTALLYPLPLAFFAAVQVASVVMTVVLGRARWKGRTIVLRSRRHGRAG